MLQHILHQAADSALIQFNQLDKISNNVANVNTAGYKGQRFEQYLRVDGNIGGVTRTDTAQGAPLMTQRPLDVAIEGPGYLPVTQPDGTTAYTRDGSFTKNADGYLVTVRGDLVGSGIQLPPYYHKVFVHPNGNIKLQLNAGDELNTIGQLKLVAFTNPEGLESIGGNKLIPTTASGPPELLDLGEEGSLATGNFKQGYLERANISMYHQVDQILRLNASVISNLRVAKYTDDLFRQSVNLRQ